MRKQTKLIAAVLLLSIVVSVFAVLPAFAATETSVETASVRRVVYDMDSLSSITISNVIAGDSLTKKTDEFGQTYWQQKHDTAKAADEFWAASVKSIAWNNADAALIADAYQTEKVTKEVTVTLADGTTEIQTMSYTQLKKDADGNYIKTSTKNTDYVIIDFDISTDSVIIPILFHTRGLRGDRATGSTTTPQSGNAYFSVNDSKETEEVYLSKNDAAGTWTTPAKSGEKWTNVTVIYDYSEDLDVEAIQGGATQTSNLAYVYIDGYYVGSISAALYKNFVTSVKDSAGGKRNVSDTDPYLRYAAAFRDIRIETPSIIQGATNNYANFTISTLPADYDGPIAADGILGNPDVHLASMSDMTWAFENLPKTPDGYKTPKVADIKRVVDGVETIIPAYTDDEVSGNVIAGDVVTLYRNLGSTIVVKSADAAAADITFIDGKTDLEAGATGSLIKKPTMLVADPDADWIRISGGKITASGQAEDQLRFKNADGKWEISDPFYANITTGSTSSTFVLFADIVSYGKSGVSSTDINGTGLATTTSSVKKPGNNNTHSVNTFDLNGYTLTVAPTTGHYMQPGGQNTIKYKNGTFIFSPTSGNLTMSNNDLPGKFRYTIFENVTLNYAAGTMIDQRTGVVAFTNCTISSTDALSSQKSTGANHASLVVNNSSVDAKNLNEIFYLGNVASSSKYYGSSNNHLSLLNSNFTRSGATGSEAHDAALIKWTPSRHTQSSTAAAYLANDHRMYATIMGCEIGGGIRHMIYQSTGVSIGTIPEGQSPMTFIADVSLIDTDLKSTSVYYATAIGGNTTNLEGNVNISLDSAVKADVIALLSRTAACEAADMTFRFADGVKLGTNDTETIDNLVFDSADSKIVYSSLDKDCECVVSPAYDPYTYQLPNADAVEFYWNKAEGEAVDMDRVVALDSKAGIYHYEWNEPAGNAYTTTLVKDLKVGAKSNLTLYDYFYYNVFIEESIYNNIKKYTTITDKDGNTLTAEDKLAEIGSDKYYKFQAKNLAPADAMDAAVTVAINVPTAYGDTITSGGEFSVLDYAQKTLAKETSTESKDLIEAIVNYIAKAAELAERADVASAAADLITGAEFEAVDESTAKFEKLEGVDLAVGYGSYIEYVFAAEKGTQLKIAYTFDGESTEIVKTVGDTGYISVRVKACDLINDVTVTKTATGESATFNLAGYYAGLEGKDAAQSMVAAIYNYAKAAAAYKATLEA